MGDAESRTSSTKKTGGLPIVGPIRYPNGLKEKGKGKRKNLAVDRKQYWGYSLWWISARAVRPAASAVS